MKFLVSLSPKKKKKNSKFAIFVLEIPMCVDIDLFIIYDLSTYYFDFWLLLCNTSCIVCMLELCPFCIFFFFLRISAYDIHIFLYFLNKSTYFSFLPLNYGVKFNHFTNFMSV